jgi:hypothetical protein
MLKTNLDVNMTCIVRDRPCGRIFTGSNTCFVACPTSDEVGLEIEIIKSALLDEEIEPYIAVEHFEAGRDIFCTKICTKIIESKFCVVVLSGNTNEEGIVIPNPNVYYEYGVMTSWNKYIIPIQRSDQKLAFNIQSLDTIKYSPSTFKEQLEKAVRIAIASTEEREEKEERTTIADSLSLYFELKGLSPLDKTWTINNTNYLSFARFNYGTVLHSVDEVERVYYDTKVIVRRLERYVTDLDRKIQGIEKSYEKANTEAQKAGVKKQIDKLKYRKETVHPQFTIVLMQPEVQPIIKKRMNKIESSLSRDVHIISLEDMKADMDIS